MKYQPYTSTRKARHGRLGKIPAGWEERRIKFAASYNDESLPETTASDQEIHYVDISAVNLVEGITAIETMPFDESPSRARRIVRDGDTIISTVRTYLKAIAPIQTPDDFLIVSTGFAVVRPLQFLNSRFLGYYLQGTNFVDEVGANSTGVSYPAIKPSTLVTIPIVYPLEKDEQQQIADFLVWKTGQIDALIAKKRELIDKLKEQRIAVITQAVTKGLNPNALMRDSKIEWIGEIPEHWDVQKLKFNVSKIGSGVTPSGGAESYEDEGIPLLRSQNVHFEGLKLSDVVFISEETHLDMKNSHVKEGDVLLNITGASIGRCNFADQTLGVANVNQHVCIIRPEDGISTQYLYYLLWSEVGQTQIELEQSGSGREGLNFVTLKNFTFPLPDISEQNRIVKTLVRKLGKLSKLATKVSEAEKKLVEYRTALITAATTGKIDVRNVKVGV